MRWWLSSAMLAFLLVNCAPKQAQVQEPEPPTTYVVPGGVDPHTRMCFELPWRWTCVTVKELREMLSAQRRT